MEPKKLTPEEAAKLLKNGKTVHTFRNPGGMLIGADWDRKDIIEVFDKHPDNIQIGGDLCRQMNHAIVLNDGTNLFIENDEKKLNEFDPVTK